MGLTIGLLHQYTRILDRNGEKKNQYIYFTKENLALLIKDIADEKEIKNFKLVEGNGASFSMDGYDFIAYGNIVKNK
jgi:hypothetical protein